MRQFSYRQQGRVLLSVVAFVLAVCGASAAAPGVKSTALTDQFKVDGDITEWPTLLSLTKEVSVAAANDEDRLVLAIATSDASAKHRLLSAGVTVYLDPKGKKTKTFGVRIPPAPGAGGGLPAVTYVEVIGPKEKESHIVDLATRTDFQVARGDNQGTLLIELAIPLRPAEGSEIAAPAAESRNTFGLGFVTPDVPAAGRGSSGGGAPGGGGGGRGGMGGGMGGGMLGGMGGGRGPGGAPPGGAPPGGEQGKELKAWTTLELAPRAASLSIADAGRIHRPRVRRMASQTLPTSTPMSRK